jgi:hypothetical protein
MLRSFFAGSKLTSMAIYCAHEKSTVKARASWLPARAAAALGAG